MAVRPPSSTMCPTGAGQRGAGRRASHRARGDRPGGAHAARQPRGRHEHAERAARRRRPARPLQGEGGLRAQAGAGERRPVTAA
eukprot:1421644-Prymnesium_polylepis.1